ncbi:unnamed protein product, partial [Ixodes pacificus]
TRFRLRAISFVCERCMCLFARSRVCSVLRHPLSLLFCLIVVFARPRHQVWRVELMMRRDGKASLHGAACKRRFVLESAGPVCGKQVLRRTGQGFPSLSETSFERKITCRYS